MMDAWAQKMRQKMKKKKKKNGNPHLRMGCPN